MSKKLLKVAVCALAAEASITRREERKSLNLAKLLNTNSKREENEYANDDAVKAQKAYEDFWGLERYRKHDIRREARANQLAYGFLNGRDYSEMEETCYSSPNWNRVEQIVFAYSDDDPRVVKQHLEEWMQNVQPPKLFLTDNTGA